MALPGRVDTSVPRLLCLHPGLSTHILIHEKKEICWHRHGHKQIKEPHCSQSAVGKSRNGQKGLGVGSRGLKTQQLFDFLQPDGMSVFALGRTVMAMRWRGCGEGGQHWGGGGGWKLGWYLCWFLSSIMLECLKSTNTILFFPFASLNPLLPQSLTLFLSDSLSGRTSTYQKRQP